MVTAGQSGRRGIILYAIDGISGDTLSSRLFQSSPDANNVRAVSFNSKGDLYVGWYGTTSSINSIEVRKFTNGEAKDEPLEVCGKERTECNTSDDCCSPLKCSFLAFGEPKVCRRTNRGCRGRLSRETGRGGSAGQAKGS